MAAASTSTAAAATGTSGSPIRPTRVDQLHRRFDRLTGAWVLVAPSRNVRPSSTTSGADRPRCPLCPGGGELAGGFALAVFDNRFPALAPGAPPVAGDDDRMASSRGRCQVVVHTARHVERAADLSAAELVAVTAVLRERTAALWRAGHRYVMAFENHGAAVGATLPHQHGQLYALDHLPPVTAAKRDQLGRHREAHGTCLGCTIVAEDLAGERVLEVGEWFVVSVPFAPRWPYEVHVTARAHGIGRLGQLDDAAVLELTRLLAGVVDRYDGLWGHDAAVHAVRPGGAGGRGRAAGGGLAPPRRAAAAASQRRAAEGPRQRRDRSRDVHQRHRARADRRRAAGRGARRAVVGRHRGPDDRGRVTTVVAFAPGRVNLIGDHTDHTGGFCFPMAIERGVTVRATEGGQRVRLRSDDRVRARRHRPRRHRRSHG